MKNKPFLIGIDSDGTAFDSMEIKHRRVFQPVAVEVWELGESAEAYNSIAESINLYSTLRGINRFEGLALAFQRLLDSSKVEPSKLAGLDDLHAFIEKSSQLSLAALEAFNATHVSAFLSKVITWSRRCDEVYSEIMESEGNTPFAGVRDSLISAAEQANIFVISSSSCITLDHDWKGGNLMEPIEAILGQEQGNKTHQLSKVIPEGIDPSNTLMIGDAPGDLDAAEKNNALFFPIMPGAEVASWERFQKEALPKFFSGAFAGAYQESLLAEFSGALVPDAGMQKTPSI